MMAKMGGDVTKSCHKLLVVTPPYNPSDFSMLRRPPNRRADSMVYSMVRASGVLTTSEHDMKATIRAIFQKGVLKPVDSLDLRENEVVKVTVEDSGDIAVLPGGTGSLPGDRYHGIRGLFSHQDLKEIEAALHDCRQVDPDGW